ncbi:MAG: beta-N-acetylhexosaminidase [Anaerolineae bacterium]|nr:beta-N-acetylhexosaminidase [Anaerolineae bacterium]
MQLPTGLCYYAVSSTRKDVSVSKINVIPKPNRVVPSDGTFSLQDTTSIYVSSDAAGVGNALHELVQAATGYSLPVQECTTGNIESDAILLTTSGADASLGDEGYELIVTPKSVVVRAPKPAGLFYGVQTLRQLLPPEIESDKPVSGVAWVMPAVTITDSPRFAWRGMHLDVGRHMFPVEFIKRYIDLLAMHKMNVFHWHLTEDQGWRIQVNKHPKLVQIGSKREATPIPANRKKLDGKPYEGFYTQEQIKEIVAYAANRFVTVVPEIEMPGHAVAALTSYPELGCTGGPYKVRTWWGIAEDVFCAGNDQVFTFLEDVLTEVLDLFPSKFIHIGGDECPKDRWKQCPKCQARIQKEGLKDEHELQSYFIQRIEGFLNAQNRQLIGWDEILEGGLAPNAVVMSWRGSQGGIDAALAGHDVVMSPNTHCYFDYYQSADRENEPPAIGGFVPLEKVYAFEPVPETLSPEQGTHIIGIQGNMWTEYMPTSQQVEYMVYPRACALAEVAWSAANARDLSDFMKRLEALLARLDRLGIHFRKLDPK